MPAIWYFDVVSPFAYLQWRRLKPLLATHDIRPVPILFAAVLSAIGNRGPAEIPAKRTFTYQHVAWRAQRDGIALVFPPAHPFNPIAALRTVIAADADPDVIEAVFAHIWAQGQPGDSVEALAPVLTAAQLSPADVEAPAVKARLRAETDAAIAAGMFGVPTLRIGDALFWGEDAHDFALAALADPGLLDTPEMQRLAQLPVGAARG
ncbi:2-hydroxychromene-2-carboxylate isomerase [Luteimonas fraxinea]|uniref:2-hydroxychromene-2-carboxylate isomerase n=1 Tax=Luteimonas fraxinea TaxID=2901869 RepID=UPI001E442CA4|nr:2-hydroxychromene-2-carboxylate isomerase [Luteimonas fraxinea]MCD9125240.1 2-hydroxychromene-2-carboxylate isomerase [Luteimonas fraxinea]